MPKSVRVRWIAAVQWDLAHAFYELGTFQHDRGFEQAVLVAELFIQGRAGAAGQSDDVA